MIQPAPESEKDIVTLLVEKLERLSPWMRLEAKRLNLNSKLVFQAGIINGTHPPPLKKVLAQPPPVPHPRFKRFETLAN